MKVGAERLRFCLRAHTCFDRNFSPVVFFWQTPPPPSPFGYFAAPPPNPRGCKRDMSHKARVHLWRMRGHGSMWRKVSWRHVRFWWEAEGASHLIRRESLILWTYPLNEHSPPVWSPYGDDMRRTYVSGWCIIFICSLLPVMK